MNLINLLGNLFGFRKRSSQDREIEKKFPGRKKSPLIYDPTDIKYKSYADWREKNFGKYSDLDVIDNGKDGNKERIKKEYSDIEDLVVLDKEAKNSKLRHCYEQIKRFDQILKSDLFASDVKYNASIFREAYELKFKRTKIGYTQSILTRDVASAVYTREDGQKNKDIIMSYFESRLKY